MIDRAYFLRVCGLAIIYALVVIIFLSHLSTYGAISVFLLYVLIPCAIGIPLAVILESRKKSESVRNSQIRYLDIMGRISQIGAVAETPEEMLDKVLEEILTIFDADRAWLLFPCDPNALYWSAPIEHTRPEWPGVLALGKLMPINSEVKKLFENALNSTECIQYSSGTANTVPSEVASQFSIKSQMAIALKPKYGNAWLMGLHHCRELKLHDKDEEHIFKGIAERVSDSLSSFASMKTQRESEERYFGLFQNAPVGLFQTTLEGKILAANPAMVNMLGYPYSEKLLEKITNIKKIYVDPNKRAQIIEKVMKQNEWVHDEVKLHSANKNIITANIILRKVLNPDGSFAYLEGFFQDITEQKKSEIVLTENEQRFRILNDLSEATLILENPQEVLTTICNLLGAHLKVTRCAYADVGFDSDQFYVPYDYYNGCESIVGKHKLSQFGQLAVSILHAGRTFIMNNIDKELFPRDGLKKFQSTSIKAVVCCPLVRNGKLKALMAVHQTTEREWTQSEISLIEEVAERCWAIIERTRTEKERNKLVDIIERSLNEIVLFDAKTLLFTYANEGARRNLGYTLDQLTAMTPLDIKVNIDKAMLQRIFKPLLKRQKEQIVFESLHRRADGTTYPVEIHLQLTNLQDSPQFLAFIQDISERKNAEDRIQRLSKLYKALSETNQAIVHMQEQDELFPLVCKCAVEFGGMKLAWFGQVDESSGAIVPVTVYGGSQDYVRKLRLSYRANVPEGRGPAGVALRENKIIIINDFLNDPMTTPWQDNAAKYGLCSGAAFPVQRGGKPFAVFFVYHELMNAFDDEAIGLLHEMSNDISFALDNFDRETERKIAQDALILAASVYENSSEAMTITDPEGVILNVNPSFTQITGYLPEDVIGKNSSAFSSSHHDEDFYKEMWDSINKTGRWQGEIWDRRKDGGVYPAWLTINTIYDEDRSPYRRISLFSDTTAWKESETLIWQQANFDPLTELPNRQMFYDRLDQEIKKAHRAEKPMALMFIDLDRFKEINDTLGHDMGDILLKEAAQRLTSCVRETDTVARLGGDEFTVILGDIDDPTNVERVALNILNKLAKPFKLKAELGYISASIGITMYPEDATELDELIKNADQAMYEAKNLGRNRYSYFTSSMQKSAQFRMQIANDLRTALSKKQLFIAYQPIVKLSDRSILKAEALIRWKHPKLGLISPAEFIPVAEHTGLITDIGDWVFRESAAQVKSWQETYGKQFQISVNVSPVQINDKSKKFKPWHKQLKSFGLSGKSIIVEITEGLLLEANLSTNEKLLEYRDAGIQVALDDFGTGYSSLSYLKKFDIDYIKIDQAFIRNLKTDSGDMALCEAMIVMAHKLNMLVIAEGVETTEQLDILTKIGCDYAQGYLFSKPVVAAEFEKILNPSRALVTT
jgi:diguanylate cyclase (GGDEF)-like protein/PAS domain S-box-containing protein